MQFCKFHRKKLKIKTYYTLSTLLYPWGESGSTWTWALYEDILNRISTLTMISLSSILCAFPLGFLLIISISSRHWEFQYGMPQNVATFSALVIIIIASSCDTVRRRVWTVEHWVIVVQVIYYSIGGSVHNFYRTNRLPERRIELQPLLYFL